MWLLLRILINLYHKLYRALYYPISLLLERAFGIIILLIVGYVVMQFFSEPEPEYAATQPLPQQQTSQQNGNVPLPKDHNQIPQAQAVTNKEDGNSAFSSDLLQQMTPEELQYYSETYYWVMDQVPDAQSYNWNYINIHGSITPTTSFKNNMGHGCRRFQEVLKVHNTEQTLEGIACKRAGGGWCKLRRTATPVCGIAPERGFGAWWRRSVPDIF